MKKQRILLTGASGFVGRHLVQQLLAEGKYLTLLTRTARGWPDHWRDTAQIKVIETGPLENAENLDDALAGVSGVVHMAGLAHVPGNTEDQLFQLANVAATERLVHACEGKDVTTFVYLSSIAAVTESSSDSVIDDSTPDNARTPYGKSKLAGEKIVSLLAEKGTLSVSMRPPLIVGGDAKGNWQTLQRLAAMGLPLPFGAIRNRRSLVDVEQLSRAIALVCSREWSPRLSGSYCMASPQAVSLRDMIADLRRGMNISPRLIPIPPSILGGLAQIAGARRLASQLLGNLVIDGSRFRKVFDFSETRSISESIQESGMLYLRNGR